MSWSLTIKDEKYSIYSSISDEYIVENLSKEELFRFLFWVRLEDNFIEKMVEDFIIFPVGWTNKETGAFYHDKEKYKELYKLKDDRNKKVDYFLEQINLLGIDFDIKDNIDDYHLSSKDDYVDNISEQIKIAKEDLNIKYNIKTDRDLVKQLNLSNEDKQKVFAWIRLQSLYSLREGIEKSKK